MADTKVQAKAAIADCTTDEIQIGTGVFVVTHIQVVPVQGNYTRLTIHYARGPEEVPEGRQQKQKFLLRDDLAKALAAVLGESVTQNVAEDVINRANGQWPN